MDEIENSYERLIDHIVSNDRCGWDPYDGLNTPYALLTSTRSARLFSQYFHKFSPVNLRPLFGVRKSRQLQAAAFIGLALENYSGKGSREDFVREIVGDLKASSMRDKYGYHCWDPHGFPIQMRKSYTPVGTTDVIGNEACGRLLHRISERTGDEKAGTIAEDVARYIIKVLRVDKGDVAFFKYKPITPDWSCTYNASVLAAAFVTKVLGGNKLTDEECDFLERCFHYVCKNQRNEGYWCYSIDLRSGNEKHQVDFHQGFILDCLLEYMQMTGFREPFVSAYRKGLRFYKEKQFFNDGRGIYRWPKIWPVNIHNQAQGIITFSRACEVDPEYMEFSEKIARWTIREMQHRNGHFYFMKYPMFKNKIPYIRWSDAAMAYALAVLLKARSSRGNVRLAPGG